MTIKYKNNNNYQALSISALWLSGMVIRSDTFDGVWACKQFCL